MHPKTTKSLVHSDKQNEYKSQKWTTETILSQKAKYKSIYIQMDT